MLWFFGHYIDNSLFGITVSKPIYIMQTLAHVFRKQIPCRRDAVAHFSLWHKRSGSSVFQIFQSTVMFKIVVMPLTFWRATDWCSVPIFQGCEGRSGTSSSTSSDWDTRSRSSAESSDEQGTPKLRRGELLTHIFVFVLFLGVVNATIITSSGWGWQYVIRSFQQWAKFKRKALPGSANGKWGQFILFQAWKTTAKHRGND